ncbi:MAG: STAS domain-containing protein [Bacillota bacterium]
MTIDKDIQGNVMTLKIAGRLDTTTSPELEQVLVSSLDGIEDLRMDFTDLEYISSAGLRILLSAQKTMNKQGTMSISGVNDTIMEIFGITGFSDILTIR